MNNDVLEAAHAIWSLRYSDADVVLAAGSIVPAAIAGAPAPRWVLAERV